MLSAAKIPKGLIKDKSATQINIVVFELFERIKKVVNTMAIGILCTTIAHNKFTSSEWIGIPSEKA